MTAKSIWIDLDSVHSSLILEGIRTHRLPNLRRIADEGSAGPLRMEIPLQVAAWASAHTGRSAVDHGAFAYDRPVRNSYRLEVATQPVEMGTAYWDALSGAGKRVLVINSVNPIPSPDINGIQIGDWLTSVAGRSQSAWSWPRSVARSLAREFGVEKFYWERFAPQDGSGSGSLLAAVARNIRSKRDLYCHYLDREPWDHVHLGFDDLHGLGHALHERNEDSSDLMAGPEGTALVELDAALGPVLAHAGPDAQVLVVSLGGIGAVNNWSNMVDKILGRLLEERGNSTRLYSSIGRYWNGQPYWLKRLMSPVKSQLREAYLARGRRRSRAFALPLNEECGGVRVNLRGREPEGKVSPGEDFESLGRLVREALLELRDVDSDEALVKDVWFVSDLVPGRSDHGNLPDIFIDWNRARTMTAVSSERMGRIDLDFRHANRGEHVRDGLLLSNMAFANGPAGARRNGISVLDLAPEVLALHRAGCGPRPTAPVPAHHLAPG